MQIPEMILEVAARSREMKPSSIISRPKGGKALVHVSQKARQNEVGKNYYGEHSGYLLSSSPLLCKVDSGEFSSATETHKIKRN
jgi:hypothetical protein